jgi:hypothetical protein
MRLCFLCTERIKLTHNTGISTYSWFVSETAGRVSIKFDVGGLHETFSTELNFVSYCSNINPVLKSISSETVYSTNRFYIT